MVEVKLTGKPLAERIADRRKHSGEGLGADVKTVAGDGDRRTITAIHHSAGHTPVRDVRSSSPKDQGPQR